MTIYTNYSQIQIHPFLTLLPETVQKMPKKKAVKIMEKVMCFNEPCEIDDELSSALLARLKQAKECAPQYRSTYEKALFFLRSKNPLPQPESEALYDLTVQFYCKIGENEELVFSCPKCLLQQEYYTSMFSSGCLEAQTTNNVHKIVSRLSKEALLALKIYIYSLGIGVPTARVFYELQGYAQMTFDTDLQNHLQQYTQQYLKESDTQFTIIKDSRLQMPLSDYLVIFQQGDELLDVFAQDIDSLVVNTEDAAFLYAIKKRHRQTITSLCVQIGSQSAIALTLRLQELFPNALLHFCSTSEEYLESQPPICKIDMLLGEIHRQKQNLTEAENCFLDALKSDATNSFTLSRLGDIRRLQGNLDEAKQYLGEAVRINLKNSFALARLGEVLYLQGNVQESEQYLLQAIRHDPKNSFALARLGEINRENGKLSDAEKYLFDTVTYDPTNSFALARLGRIQFEQGNLDTAEKYLQQAIRFKPPDATPNKIAGPVRITLRIKKPWHAPQTTSSQPATFASRYLNMIKEKRHQKF